MVGGWVAAGTGWGRLRALPCRIDGRAVPPVSLVDTRNDRRGRSGVAIGRALEMFIKQALDDDGQAILFLNLRGHSPAVWCRACGQGMRCGGCDVTLTWHRHWWCRPGEPSGMTASCQLLAAG